MLFQAITGMFGTGQQGEIGLEMMKNFLDEAREIFCHAMFYYLVRTLFMLGCHKIILQMHHMDLGNQEGKS